MQANMPNKDKVMHAAFHVGDTQIMATDGQCTGKGSFSGVSLTLNAGATPRPRSCSTRSPRAARSTCR